MSNIPMRRCVGCMQSKPQKELIRLTSWQNSINIDKGKKSDGRGVYLCKDEGCLKKAIKKRALIRALKVEPTEAQINEIRKEIENKQ